MRLFKNFYLFLFVIILVSCSSVFENSNTTDFSVSLDLSQLVKNQNKSHARSANATNNTLTLTLYDAQNYSKEEANDAISNETLSVISNVEVTVNLDSPTKVSFIEIPVGKKAIIFAQCSIFNDDSQTKYEGCSNVFEVKRGKNPIEIELKKIKTNIEDGETPEEPEKTEPEPSAPESEEKTVEIIEVTFDNEKYEDVFESSVFNQENITLTVNVKDSMHIDSYQWVVDGEVKYNTNDSFDFSSFAPGLYTIMVIVTDSDGNLYSATAQIEVKLQETAVAGPAEA